MRGTIGVGIMGAGWPGRMHAEALQTVRGVAVTAIAEPDPQRQAEFAKSYGCADQFGDYRAMLREGRLDAVVVALPTAMHYRACMDALAAGCHVLCEKPPATTVAEMTALARAVRRSKLTYMFARQQRYRAEVLAARKLVQAGRLGSIYHAESKWIRARGMPKGGWRLDRDQGGGVLLDLGVHMIDNAWFVMGCPRPVSVFGGMHTAFKHLAPPGVTCTADDTSVGMVRFEGGATRVTTVTFAMNTAGAVATDVQGVVRPDYSEVRVYGTKGGADVWAAKFIEGRRNDVCVKPLVPAGKKKVRDFHAQAREFIRAVRAKDEPLTNRSRIYLTFSGWCGI